MAQSALRDRQVELTRDSILEALGGLIGEGRLADFSIQDVADRAGVSLRTVYRHFPSREALLEGFAPWSWTRSRAAGAAAFPTRAEEIAPMMRTRYLAFEQLAPLVLALTKLDAATGIGVPIAQRSIRTIRGSLSDLTQGLEPELAEAVAWTVRIIWSHKTWAAYHDEGGLDATHAGAAAAWAVELIIEALRDGRGPSVALGGEQ